MTNVTRTIYASGLQAAQVLGIPYDIPDNTTLNEKFDVLPTTRSPQSEYPVMKYLAIGRGGHRNASGADGESITRLNVHRASDAALFQHLPFVLRELDNDLSPAERERYALRREEVHNNQTYIAYYLLRLDHTNVEIGYNRIVVENNDQTVLPYTPSSSDLNPTPLEIQPTEVNVSNGEYLAASTVIELLFSTDIIREIVDAARTIYGEEVYATLSEIGLCSGVDHIAQAQNGEDSAFNYTEAIDVQVNTHFTTHHQLWMLSQSLRLDIDLGGTEGLSI